MIKLIIRETAKGIGSKEDYRIFNIRTEMFENLKDAKSYIKESYNGHKRTAMYRDEPDGTSYKCGYVIGFKNADWSHSPVVHWFQQDWIYFTEYEEKEVIL